MFKILILFTQYFLIHNFLYIVYPSKYNHDYQTKNNKIVEFQNILWNLILFYNTSLHLYFNYTISKYSYMVLNIMICQMFYEIFIYYLLLNRKNLLILFHHLLTLGMTSLVLNTNHGHTLSCILSTCEITNIFFSISLIAKTFKNKKVLIISNNFLILSYICFRILSLPIIIYNFNYISIGLPNYMYIITKILIITLWFMSLYWFEKLYNKVMSMRLQ